MDKNRQTVAATAPVTEKVVDKKGPAVQKIEEENTKAEHTLKSVIDLLKQEIEK